MDTIRSLPSGAGLLPPSAISCAAGSPWACSSAHICGSQDTIASADTCAAIQRAAAVRAAAAARMAAGVGAPPVPAWAPAARLCPAGAGLRVTAMVIAPAPKSTAATTSRVSTRQRVWRGQRTCRRRCAHSCTVVSSTFPHDGGGGVARPEGRGGPPPAGAGAAGGPARVPGGRAGGEVPAGGAPAGPGASGLSASSAAPAAGPPRRSFSWSWRASVTASCAAARSVTDKMTASWAASALKSRAGRLARDGSPSGWAPAAESPGTGPADFIRRICGCTHVPHRARKE